MVVGDQKIESGFRAGLQLRDQLRFVTAPREGAGPIGHAVPFWRGVPLLLWGLPAVWPCSAGLCCPEAAPCPLVIRHQTERSCFLNRTTDRLNLAPVCH